MIHGVHHDYPNDARRLVLPPAFSIPLALMFLGLFVVVLGRPLAWPVSAGFYLGYVIYDTLHYALHHMNPRGRIGHRLRNSTCATISRTTSAASASAPPGGTSSSTHARAAEHDH